MATRGRTIIAVAIAVVAGVVALPLVFSDLGPKETVILRVFVAGSVFFIGGVLVGAVAADRWPVSGLCAWTPLGMGLVMLASKLTVQEDIPYWSAIGAFLLGPLAVALAGGYVGYRLVGRMART